MNGVYQPIQPVNGRLPSEVLGLHLEPDGDLLRFWNPATGNWLPIPPEVRQQLQAGQLREADAQRQAEAAWQQQEEALRQVEAALAAEKVARQLAEAQRLQEAQARKETQAELDRLRRELDELRRGKPE